MFRIRSKQVGFTIVEMVIVMLILGIMASAAAPSYLTAMANHQINSASRRMIADLKLAQSEAQRTSSQKAVVFDIVNNKYTLIGVSDFNRPGVDYSFELGQSEYQVKLSTADFSGSATVSFDIYGRPNAAGSVVILNTSGTATHTVKVDVDGNISRIISG